MRPRRDTKKNEDTRIFLFHEKTRRFTKMVFCFLSVYSCDFVDALFSQGLINLGVKLLRPESHKLHAA